MKMISINPFHEHSVYYQYYILLSLCFITECQQQIQDDT